MEHEDLSWVQSNVEEVITMLQQCPGLPAVPEVSALSLEPFMENTANIVANL